jgi:hypothetical protein
MNAREPFFIGTYAASLEELKKLPLEAQGLLLLKRLRKLYYDHKVQPQRFYKGNFLNFAAQRPDPESLAVSFPENEKWAVLEHLLGQPWHYLEQNFYVTSKSGDGWYELTQQGLDKTNDEVGTHASAHEIRGEGRSVNKAADAQPPVSSKEKPNSPKVFISYSHDSETHLKLVLALSDHLRSDGVDCHIDQYEASPPEGWPRWCDKQVRDADFVLVACTGIYLRRFQGEEETGKGLGVIWEGHIITQELYNAQMRNRKFLPIMFASEDEMFIPTPLQGATHYQLPEHYDDLYRRLTNQPLIAKPPLGTMKSMPSLRMPALQALKPRESFFALPTETFSHEETIRSGGEQLYNDLIAANFISHSVGPSRTVRELIEELAAHSNKPIPIDSICATFGEQRAPRGSVFFGNPGNHLEEILSAYPKVRWWISSRGLNVEGDNPDSEVSERSKEQPAPPAARGTRPQENPTHNVVFLSAAFVKIAYSGPGYSQRTDGMHSFSEIEGASKGDMIGLVARFRNEALYGQEITIVRAVRAHLKLFDQNNQEIGTGYSSALWLGHPSDTLDLVPNGRGGSVLVCWGSKTKARVSWKTRVAIDRLRDNDTELRDGYPSRAEVTLMDSNHRPLLKPIILEITKTAGELSVVAR